MTEYLLNKKRRKEFQSKSIEEKLSGTTAGENRSSGKTLVRIKKHDEVTNKPQLGKPLKKYFLGKLFHDMLQKISCDIY